MAYPAQQILRYCVQLLPPNREGAVSALRIGNQSTCQSRVVQGYPVESLDPCDVRGGLAGAGSNPLSGAFLDAAVTGVLRPRSALPEHHETKRVWNGQTGTTSAGSHFGSGRCNCRRNLENKKERRLFRYRFSVFLVCFAPIASLCFLPFTSLSRQCPNYRPVSNP